ncbi:MAG: outer membrane beta-barrel protein [Brumimicrobium sp.]
MRSVFQNIIILLIVFYTVVETPCLSQWEKKSQNYFGFQFKPLIPFGFVGDRPFDLTEGNFETTISPTFGYSYGGVVRIGLSELLAIETGLNYTKRNFRADYSLPDSNIVDTDEIGFINFELPINFLVYIKLGNKTFMNTSMGASANFNPSNVRSTSTPEGAHLFVFEGRRNAFFTYDVNANVGFEYRTEKDGFFYLGISGKLPLVPVFQIATEYRNDTHSQVAFGQVEGATFSIDIKYFFHNARKRGVQPNKGPIEQ